MTKIFLSFWVCVLAVSVQAQDNKIYTSNVDKSPIFNGEIGSEVDYIIDHYRRPADAPEKVMNVEIAFVVEKNGKLSNIEIKGHQRLTSKGVEERPVPPSVKKEVMRILTAMPAWTPATKNGKVVRYKEEILVSVMDRETKAKEAREATEAREKKIRESKASGKVYDVALSSWIKANIKYPAKAKEKGVIGRVVVTFIVEIDGSLTDIKVNRNTAPEFKAEFEAEAIRLVKAMPAWNPARNTGVVVRYRYTCPIVFK